MIFLEDDLIIFEHTINKMMEIEEVPISAEDIPETMQDTAQDIPETTNISEDIPKKDEADRPVQRINRSQHRNRNPSLKQRSQ